MVGKQKKPAAPVRAGRAGENIAFRRIAFRQGECAVSGEGNASLKICRTAGGAGAAGTSADLPGARPRAPARRAAAFPRELRAGGVGDAVRPSGWEGTAGRPAPPRPKAESGKRKAGSGNAKSPAPARCRAGRMVW